MRHRVRKHLKFKKKDFSHRKAMQRNLLTSFFLHKQIKTTEKKAKFIVPMIDKLINTVNTKDEMNAIRYVTHIFKNNSDENNYTKTDKRR